jgi:hypothetical protein
MALSGKALEVCVTCGRGKSAKLVYMGVDK